MPLPPGVGRRGAGSAHTWRLGHTSLVSIRLTRPCEDQLQRLLRMAENDSLTYRSIEISRDAVASPRYHFDRWSRRLGAEDAIWRRACDAIRTSQAHRGAGLTVCSDGPPAVGANIAMSPPLPVGQIDTGCRVVVIDDEPDRFGFSYGTLSSHPEQGEGLSFAVVRLADGELLFEIVAASRPRQVLARALSRLARRLQRSATTRYLDTMARATAGTR